MPKIAWFYGIAISMYYNDHTPPHFHAEYQGFRALVRIDDGSILAGRLPPTAARLVESWAAQRQAELQANWERGELDVAFERIPGPDHQGR